MLRPELAIASVSAETVHERRALLVLLTLEDGESWGLEASMVAIGRTQGVGEMRWLIPVHNASDGRDQSQMTMTTAWEVVHRAASSWT